MNGLFHNGAVLLVMLCATLSVDLWYNSFGLMFAV